jgi:hypothetical protein
MTNTRVTDVSVVEWDFCPWCGQRLELDQSPDDIAWYDDGTIDVAESEANGFNFDQSVKHCGFHIRLWVPVDEEATIS